MLTIYSAPATAPVADKPQMVSIDRRRKVRRERRRRAISASSAPPPCSTSYCCGVIGGVSTVFMVFLSLKQFFLPTLLTGRPLFYFIIHPLLSLRPTALFWILFCEIKRFLKRYFYKGWWGEWFCLCLKCRIDRSIFCGLLVNLCGNLSGERRSNNE